MKQLSLLICLCLFLATACEEASAPLADAPIVVDTPFSLRPPQKAHSADLSLSILEVIDSRCPQDVACIWEGEVTVRVQVQNQQGSDELELSLHQPETDGRNQASWGNFIITLEAVSMPPGHKASWQTGDYDVRLRVSRP